MRVSQGSEEESFEIEKLEESSLGLSVPPK